MERILFFDGVCNLCNGVIDFLIRRDSRGRLRFAPLQGSTARARLQLPATIEDSDLQSVVLWSDGRTHRGSGAVLRALVALGGAWQLAGALLLIPAPIRDLFYFQVARNRYRWFGRRSTCRLPSAEEKARFLD